ncbi:hypothetical protein [Litoreibacter ascidiaceicola]|uniref:hypothetical protein n=1 Tax=Litoreibacter ascidiaceicola TaxID=1486859 RepID=UPI001FE434B5|nr:hypothetical protein [Litoreibacter ascidiaceicola]
MVEAICPEATLFKPGDEVYYAGDITRSGTNAEFHLVDESQDFAPPTLIRIKKPTKSLTL